MHPVKQNVYKSSDIEDASESGGIRPYASLHESQVLLALQLQCVRTL